MRLRCAIILVGVSFSGSEFWWGDQGGCGFYVSVLPELFVYTMVYTYWLPDLAADVQVGRNHQPHWLTVLYSIFTPDSRKTLYGHQSPVGAESFTAVRPNLSQTMRSSIPRRPGRPRAGNSGAPQTFDAGIGGEQGHTST
jgi:hypothetical protein